MKKIFLFLIIFLSVSSLAESRMNGMGASFDFIPQPRLTWPIKEEINLTGKDSLEFKWSPHEGRASGREYFDFRLYKGYNMLESTLVLKERVSPYSYSFSVKSDFFEDGQIYTWSLRQVYSGVGKSDRSFSSFKVIKK